MRKTYRVVRKGTRRIKALRYPLTSSSLTEALASFVAPDVVLVHSSLSACGYIVGGTSAAVEALRTWLGGKTLAMPTHSYCYPDSTSQLPVFDPRTTPSVVGAITNAFWCQPGVRRSVHPTHSLAAEGPAATALIEGHEKCETPCGAGTPYERLVKWDAAVLMFGASLESYTLFHTAEDAANVPYLYEPEPYVLKVLCSAGTLRDVVVWRQDMKVQRRFREMDIWLERRGLLERKRLGRGELLYIPSAASVHRALLDAQAGDPFFLTAKGRCAGKVASAMLVQERAAP